MSVVLRNRVRLLAFLSVAVCSMAADTRSAPAQSVPTRTLPAAPILTPRRGYNPRPQMVRYIPVESDEPAGYWIVSSRRCPQSARTVNGCRTDIFEVRPAGQTFLSTRQRMINSLAPGEPVCIVVHGSFMTTAEFVAENPAVKRWLASAAAGRPLHLIFYRWPSEGGLIILPQVTLAVLGLQAEFNGYYLARLIADIPAENPVCLVGHSHGARTAVSALHLLGGGQVQGLILPPRFAVPRRMRAILLAAAFDHDWLNPGQRFGRALYPAEHLVNVVNRDDILLRFYPLKELFGVPALGQVGLLPGDRHMLGMLSTKAQEIDVTPLVGAAHMMPNYFNRPEIAGVIAPHIFFDDNLQPLQNVQYRPRGPVHRGPQPVRATP